MFEGAPVQMFLGFRVLGFQVASGKIALGQELSWNPISHMLNLFSWFRLEVSG